MEKRDNWQTRHPSQRRETLVKDVNFKKAVTAGKNKYKAQAVAKETAILDCTYSVLVTRMTSVVCTVLSENSLELKENLIGDLRMSKIAKITIAILCKMGGYYSYTIQICIRHRVTICISN